MLCCGQEETGERGRGLEWEGDLILLTKTSALLWVPGNSARQSLHPSDTEEDTGSRSKCSERTKKSIRGVALTLLIAFCWVGTLHLLKLTFDWNIRFVQPPSSTKGMHDPSLSSDLLSPQASPSTSLSHLSLDPSSLSPATIDPPNFTAESDDASLHSGDVDTDQPFNVSLFLLYDPDECILSVSLLYLHDKALNASPRSKDRCKLPHVACPLGEHSSACIEVETRIGRRASTANCVSIFGRSRK